MANKLLLLISPVLVMGVMMIGGKSAVSSFASILNHEKSDSLMYDGQLRDFVVHAPSQPSDGENLPVVIALHGAGGSGIQMMNLTKLNETADKYGFIAVFPNSLRHPRLNMKIWNVRALAGESPMPDDVGFIRALIDYLVEHYQADSKRIYVTGTSNGAMFSYRLLCELSDKIAAIAINAGVDAFDGECPNFTPRSILHVHDLSDRLVPIEGKETPLFNLPSVETTFTEWKERLHCSNKEPTLIAQDTLHEVYRYARSDNKAEILYYLTKDGGHGWPGSTPRSMLASEPSKAFDMNELIWSFFSKYSIH